MKFETDRLAQQLIECKQENEAQKSAFQVSEEEYAEITCNSSDQYIIDLQAGFVIYSGRIRNSEPALIPSIP